MSVILIRHPSSVIRFNRSPIRILRFDVRQMPFYDVVFWGFPKACVFVITK